MIEGPSKPPRSWVQTALAVGFLLLVAFFAALLVLGFNAYQDQPPPTDPHATTTSSLSGGAP